MKHTFINKLVYTIIAVCILTISFSVKLFASDMDTLSDDFIGPRQQTKIENIVVDRNYIEDMYRNYYDNTATKEQKDMVSVNRSEEHTSELQSP